MNMPKTADALTTIYWGTYYAGKIVGLTDSNALAPGGNEGILELGSQLNINSTGDLSQIIVGASGANVQTIQYVSTGGLRSSTIQVYGQGPAGAGSGSLDLWFLSAAGFVHTLSLTSSSPGWHTDSFEDTTGIVSIWWAQSSME
jgi:hypothetical protein